MPNKDWNFLKPIQLGRYAEYYSKMEFASFGFEIYSSEVDDHGIDFVVKYQNKYFDIQVKSIFKSSYVFMRKENFPLIDNMLLCLLIFKLDNLPHIYLIRSTEWNKPNTLLIDREYEDCKSKPEYGISITKKSLELLEKYRFDIMVNKIFNAIDIN